MNRAKPLWEELTCHAGSSAAFISRDGVVQAHQVDTLFAGDFDLLPAGGTLMATYEPAGALKTGSFETQKPSELELKRRERVKAGDW